jgi:sugar phosphate isomerase/epimerase
MLITRRALLAGAAAGLAGGTFLKRVAPALAAVPAKIRIGSCRLDLPQAKAAGLDGVEIGVGQAAETLHIAEPDVRRRYKDQMRDTGLAISSFMMGLLNSNPLATDPRGPAWLEQSIDAAADLRARAILVAFFGKGNLLDGDGKLKQAELDVVVQRVKVAAPRAGNRGVILALENTLSARQNAEILERIGHPAVRIYYDVGNSTHMGYDVPEEIRFLQDRIAIFHFKDGRDYLGEGRIKFAPVAAAIQAISYQGWIVLEAANPSNDAVADARRNATYIRKLFQMAG